MTTIPDKRQADGIDGKEKIDGYLTAAVSSRAHLGSCRSPATPPTAAISVSCCPIPDRSSCRCTPRRSSSTSCRSSNVARLFAADAGADPDRARTRRRSGCPRARRSWRRHAAGAPGRRERRRTCGALPSGGRAHCDAAAARRGALVAAVPALRHRLRRREAHVGARLLHQAFHRGVSRRGRSPAGEGRRCGANSR